MVLSLILSPGLLTAAGLGGGADIEESILQTGGVPIFGEFLDTDGETFLRGTENLATTFDRQGSQWAKGQILRPAPYDSSTFDGKSGAVDGDVLAIGFPGIPGGGAVFIFHRLDGDWLQVQTLTSAAISPQRFGASVDISGDRLVIGDPGATARGEAYIFERVADTWSEVQTVTTADTEASDFGASVAVDGERLAVGAPGYSISGIGDVGAAYIFERDGGAFAFETRLFREAPGRFATQLRLRGSTLVGIGDGSSRFAVIYEEDGGVWSRRVISGDDPTEISFVGETLVLAGEDEAEVFYRQIGGNWSSEYLLDNAGPSWMLDETNFFSQDQDAIFFREGDEWREGPGLDRFQSETYGFTGSSLAADGNFLAVGQKTFNINRGRVQIFENTSDGWQATQGLIGPLSPRARFGSALDMEDDRLVVGGDQSHMVAAGSAAVYELESGVWTLNPLPEPSLSDFDLFGISVGISGDWAAVGARGDDEMGSSAGTVYLFERVAGAWTLWGQVFASDAQSDDFFGAALALDGDILAVGARGVGSNEGAVYIFERSAVLGGISSWSEIEKLTPSTASANNAFGVALSLEGDRLLVGANQVDAGQTRPGAAYLFERAGGSFMEVQELTAGDGAGGDGFGRSVALKGDRALIGAPLSGGGTGKAYIFDHDGASFVERAIFEASDGLAGDRFGETVTLLPRGGSVGAPFHEVSGSALPSDGGVYAYRVSVPAEAVDLAVALSDDFDPVVAGGVIGYTVTVTNQSVRPALDVQVFLEASLDLEVISTSGCVQDPLAPVCSLGTLGAGVSAMIDVQARVAAAAEGTVSLHISASASAIDASPGDEDATETTAIEASTDLRATLEAIPDPVVAGTVLTLMARVENAGSATAKQVEIEALLPPEVTFLSQTGCQGHTSILSPCTLGWIEPGEIDEVQIQAEVPLGTVGPLMAEITASAATGESSPGDETASVSVAVSPAPFISFVDSEIQGVGGVDGLLGVDAVASPSDARHVYAVSPGEREIAIFSRALETCELTFDSVIGNAGVGPLAFSPNGRLLAIGDGDRVALFDRSVDGSLSLRGDAINGMDGVVNLRDVSGLVFSTDEFLYASAAGGAGAVVVLSVDGSGLSYESSLTGNIFPLAGSADLSYSTFDGRLQAASPDDSSVTNFALDADGTLIPQTSFSSPLVDPRALSASPSEAVYLAAEPGPSAMALIPANGAPTRIFDGTDGEGLDGVQDVAFDTTGEYFFSAGTAEDAVGAFRIEPGPPRQMVFVEVQRDGVDGVTDLVEPRALAVAPGTSCLYVAATGSNALVAFKALSSAVALPLFTDGFETGDLGVWSSSFP